MSGHQQNTQTETPETENPLAGVNQTTICTNESEELCIDLTAEVRLYFLRYGLFAKHNKEEHLISPDSKEDQEESLVLPTLKVTPPSLEHFDVGRTALNSGYLYLFTEGKPDLFYEYQLHIDGRAQTIYEPVYEAGQRTNAGNLEDHRVSSGEFETQKTFKENQVLWIGYSQVQWTGQYHREMLEAEAGEKTANGMVRVDCKSFLDGVEQEHVLQQSQVRATFREDQKASDTWCDNILNQINTYETEAQPEIKRDMFVVLPDPIGCAIDMAISVSDELRKHQTFVESLRSGRDPDEIELALKTEANPQPYNEEEQEQVAMVTLAQTVYQHIYSDPNSEMWSEFAGSRTIPTRETEEYEYGGSRLTGEMVDRYYPNYTSGVSREKIEIVLANDKRSEKRQLINNIQKDLAIYVFEPYYMDAYYHDLNSDAYNILGSKTTATQIFRSLAINPHNIDRSFDLPDVQSLSMPWLEQLNETLTLTNEYNLYKLLNFELEKDNSVEASTEDLFNKFADFVQGTLEVYSEYTYTAINANTTRVVTVPVLDIHTKITNRINSASKVLDFNFQATLPTTYHWTGVTSGEIRVAVPRITFSKGQPTSASRNAQNIIDNRAFKIIKNSIEIFNLGAAIITLSKEPSMRNTVATLGAITEVTQASIVMRQAVLRASGTEIARSSTILVKGLGVLGSGVTAIVSVMDARNSINEGDTSAGVAHYIAAASYGVATALVALSPAALLIGVFLLAGFLFTLLGFALTRSELERFLQDFAFRTMGGAFPPTSIGPPHIYNRVIASNRFQYTNYGPSLVSELRNFRDDLAWYMNRVIKAKATITPLGTLNNKLFINHYSITIEINIPLSEQIIRGLEIRAVYDMPEIDSDNYSIPELQVSSARLNGDATAVITEITLSENPLANNPNRGYVPNNSMMIFFRFNIGLNKYFPFTMSNGKSYYYGIKLLLVSAQSNSNEAELIALDDFAKRGGYGLELQIENITKNTLNDNFILPTLGPQ